MIKIISIHAVLLCFCSSQQQSLALTSDLSVLELTRKELENKMGSLKEEHQRDASTLKTLLGEAENQAKDVQNEVAIKLIRYKDEAFSLLLNEVIQ